MQSDSRKASSDWWLTLPARTIVMIGVATLLLVLIATVSIGIGSRFLFGMASAGARLTAVIVAAEHRNPGPEP